MTQMNADVKNGMVMFNDFLKSRSDSQMTQMNADVKQAVLRVSVPLCENGFKMVMFNDYLKSRSCLKN